MDEILEKYPLKKQISFEITPKKRVACAFTGHRELGEDFSRKKLKKEIQNLIKEGIFIFYCGMAKGFDLECGNIVISLKEKYKNLRFIACVPYYGQERNFSQKERELYAKIYKKADEKIILSETFYKGCLHNRNRYMSDRAAVLLS